MESVFLKNQLFFRSQTLQSLNIGSEHPDVEWLACSHDGFYATVYQRFLLNSKRNSQEEASKTIASFLVNQNHVPSHVFIVGLELGYHTLALLEQLPSSTKVWVFEPLLSMIHAASLIQDFSAYQERLHIFFTPDIASLLTIVNHLWYLPTYFFHAASLRIPIYKTLADHLVSLMESNINNMYTIDHFQDLWIRHILKNIPIYIQYPGIECLQGEFKDKTCMILAAGPSLEHEIDYVKHIAEQKKFLLIAVNTVLPRLLYEGIIPDIIVAIDPQNFLYYSFIPLLQSKHAPLLVVDPTISPAILRHYKGPVLCSHSPLLQEVLNHPLLEKYRLDTGGSVSTFAYSLAIYGQARRIIFLGLDLSYSHASFHLRGNEQDLLYLFHKSDRFHSWENFQAKKALPPPSSHASVGKNNQTVYIDIKFRNYISWFENRFSYYESHCPVYNATSLGVNLGYTINILIQDIQSMVSQEKKIEFTPPIHPIKRETIEEILAYIIYNLKTIRTELTEVGSFIHKENALAQAHKLLKHPLLLPFLQKPLWEIEDSPSNVLWLKNVGEKDQPTYIANFFHDLIHETIQNQLDKLDNTLALLTQKLTDDSLVHRE